MAAGCGPFAVNECGKLQRKSSSQFVLCSGGDGELVDDVDWWELNHVQCPETGKEILVQHIWWRAEIHDGKPDYYVVDWLLESKFPQQPAKINGLWTGTFRDKNRVKRTVRARLFDETWTVGDPERFDAQRLPDVKRTGLKNRGGIE
jgi:hypothetical protein